MAILVVGGTEAIKRLEESKGRDIVIIAAGSAKRVLPQLEVHQPYLLSPRALPAKDEPSQCPCPTVVDLEHLAFAGAVNESLGVPEGSPSAKAVTRFKHTAPNLDSIRHFKEAFTDQGRDAGDCTASNAIEIPLHSGIGEVHFHSDSLLVAFVSWAFHGTPDFVSRRRYIKARREQKKLLSPPRIKHAARTDLRSTKVSLDIYFADQSHSDLSDKMPVTSLNDHPMNQEDGLLPLTARNLLNLAGMTGNFEASCQGDELSGKAATDCKDNLSVRALDNVERAVAGRPHDTSSRDDSTLPPENPASPVGTATGAEADSKAPRSLEDYSYGTTDQGMGDDFNGGLDPLAKEAEDFGEDPAHEFWSWDKGEQRWVHEDEKTGVKMYAPEELD
ncbi:hypothetical protein K456DRAFT_1938537 [Colletotrichum gloeosporioides 23]|nr:hypothetical protein K456DRAFT_1938537 [Colletotrichum gloeosporioides 23]